MKVYVASVECNNRDRIAWMTKPLYVLYSFYHVSKNGEEVLDYCKSKYCKGSICDSGAFTFLNSGKSSNFDDYVKQYAQFIKKHNIQHYMEMDIDSIVGLKRVEKYRAHLENETGVTPIPVWHKSRGKDYFIQMCDEYPYVAIGGLVTHEIPKRDFPLLRWFVDTAHQHGCKIHGLGLTDMATLKKVPFDSVDSSTWTSGGRFGRVTLFDTTTASFRGRSFGVENPRFRMRDTHSIDIINLTEWVKFQKYARRHL